MRHVSRSRGYYTRQAWRGAKTAWGATASSLPVIGGTITVNDVLRGSIRHAIAVALPAPRARTFAWPAQRTDGTGGPTALPEGARLQLDPQLNLESLHLPPLVRMIAEAAQRYGMVVRDQTHKGISLFGEDARGARAAVLHHAFASQTPLELLSLFPWDRLRLLRMRLCTKAPCVAG